MPFAVPQQQAQFKKEATPQRQVGGAANQAPDPWQRQPSRQPQYRQQPQRQQYRQPQYGGRGQMQQPSVEPPQYGMQSREQQYRQQYYQQQRPPQRQGIMRGEWDQPQQRTYRGMEYAQPPQKQYFEQPPQKQYMAEAPAPSYGASIIASNAGPLGGVYAQQGFQPPMEVQQQPLAATPDDMLDYGMSRKRYGKSALLGVEDEMYSKRGMY